jgi:hypothetical protein
LLGHIGDHHYCTFSEWVFTWDEDCPDEDGAVCVTILPRSNWGGKAQGFTLFD